MQCLEEITKSQTTLDAFPVGAFHHLNDMQFGPLNQCWPSTTASEDGDAKEAQNLRFPRPKAVRSPEDRGLQTCCTVNVRHDFADEVIGAA